MSLENVPRKQPDTPKVLGIKDIVPHCVPRDIGRREGDLEMTPKDLKNIKNGIYIFRFLHRIKVFRNKKLVMLIV